MPEPLVNVIMWLVTILGSIGVIFGAKFVWFLFRNWNTFDSEIGYREWERQRHLERLAKILAKRKR